MGHLALALFHLSHINISFLKIPHRQILFLKFSLLLDENAEILCLCGVCGYECDDTERKANKRRDGWHLDEFLLQWNSVEPEPEQSRVRRHFGEYTSTSTEEPTNATIEEPTNSTTAITKPAYIRIQSRLLDAPT